MTKKKMCKYYSTTKYGWLCGMAGTRNRECPPHSNWCCEIIPAKPKVVKVKAICWINGDDIRAFSKTFNTQGYAPCTITIAAKYLRPAKGKGEK